MSTTPKVLAWALLAAACTTGDRSPTGAIADWQVDTVPVMEIGALEGDSVYQLYRVRDIVELADGGIAVANAGTQEVRIFDAAGGYVRSIGRQGEGPGEFTGLARLAVRGDTLLAYDPRAMGRLTRFRIDGTYISDLRLQAPGASFGHTLGGVLADGSSLAWSSARLPEAEGFTRDSVRLYRVGADGAILDTLGSFPGGERVLHTQQRSGNLVAVSMLMLDFYRNFLGAASGPRGFAAPTDSPFVLAWTAGRAHPDPLRWQAVPRPVDDAYIDAYIAAEAAAAETPEERRSIEESYRDVGRPDIQPFFDRLLASPDGELWVRLFAQPGAASREWLIFDEGTSPAARVVVPAAIDIRAIGKERVYALMRDDLDVEYVRAFPLKR